MPKGVEHEWTLIIGGFVVSVGISLMPKGVEHFQFSKVMEPLSRVGISLMPKGVEHEEKFIAVCADIAELEYL